MRNWQALLAHRAVGNVCRQAGKENPTLQARRCSPRSASVLYGLEQSLFGFRPLLAAVAGEVGFAQLGTPFGQGIAERREVYATPGPVLFSFQACRCHVYSPSKTRPKSRPACAMARISTSSSSTL